jgi:glycosyltransferase involved in cell wall biosynthesis
MTAKIVGSVLVRNEDVFVERAIRNIVAFCDRIHTVDHASDDRTFEILRSLAREFDHVDVRRSRNSADAHRLLAPYAGTSAWVLGVDGDELYDPEGLARLRSELQAGAHDDVFRLKAHVLNCDELPDDSRTACGWLAPPSRPITKLFNFGAVESWKGIPEPLQGGEAVFRDGYHWEARRDLATNTTWDSDPLRCLHLCFVRRSSLDPEDVAGGRRSLAESAEFDLGARGKLKRFVGRTKPAPHILELARQGKNWKQEWYARGERVTIDAAPFLDR